MDESENQVPVKKKVSEIKTFPITFDLEATKKNMMRLFRQKEHNNWNDVMMGISNELHKKMEGKND